MKVRPHHSQTFLLDLAQLRPSCIAGCADAGLAELVLSYGTALGRCYWLLHPRDERPRDAIVTSAGIGSIEHNSFGQTSRSTQRQGAWIATC